MNIRAKGGAERIDGLRWNEGRGALRTKPHPIEKGLRKCLLIERKKKKKIKSCCESDSPGPNLTLETTRF